MVYTQQGSTPNSSPPHAAIVGVEGTALSAPERELFRAYPPFGFILFKRNCVTPQQVRQLVHELCAVTGRADTPILIDQEGGRVARLRAPVWQEFPAAGTFGRIYDSDRPLALRAAYSAGCLMGQQLRAVGCNVNCAPVLDVPTPESHAGVLGDRAFAADPHAVAALGRAYAMGLRAAGILPVIKHVPGHGRAEVDSHLALPTVAASAAQLQQSDFAPFQDLADLPIAMTAHVLYPALDAQHCATLSPHIVQQVIRAGFGFKGLLLSDDITMKALPGSYAEKTTAALHAGCDAVLLNATHDKSAPDSLHITAAVLQAASPLSLQAHERWAKAKAWLTENTERDLGPEALPMLDYPQLMALAARFSVEKTAENSSESLVAKV